MYIPFYYVHHVVAFCYCSFIDLMQNKKLLEAAKDGDITSVESLLSQGAHVNYKNPDYPWVSTYAHTHTMCTLYSTSFMENNLLLACGINGI